MVLRESKCCRLKRLDAPAGAADAQCLPWVQERWLVQTAAGAGLSAVAAVAGCLRGLAVLVMDLFLPTGPNLLLLAY